MDEKTEVVGQTKEEADKILARQQPACGVVSELAVDHSRQQDQERDQGA
jgi:hypothetical protein